MKTIKLVLSCFLALLLCVTSCKETTPDAPALVEGSKKTDGPASISSASSVVAYAKDTLTTVTSIDCSPGFAKAVLYSVGPLTVEAADVLSAHLQQQLTYSQAGVRVMTASGIVVATSPTCRDAADPGYLGMAAGFAGSNISVEESGVEEISRTGGYKFAAAASNIYVNAVFYGQRLSGATQNLIVPAGHFGDLIAVVERGVDWYYSHATLLPSNGTDHYVPFSPVLNVQHSIGPVNVPANSMVDVRFDAQATSYVPNGQYQSFGRTVIQGTSATATTGTLLTRQIQGGVILGEHHSIRSHVGGGYYPTAVNGAYFNGLVYSKGYTGANLAIDTPSPTLYGRMITEVRPYVGFWEDLTRNFATVTATQQVLYSVGPIDIDANQVVEIRYQAAFDPSALTYVLSKIVRATSPTATTGLEVQRSLKRNFHNSYKYGNINQSTAERPATAQTGQYYNVVVWRTGGATTMPVEEWGELEVVKR